MPLKLLRLKSFVKDQERMKKRGKDLHKLHAIVESLIHKKQLAEKHRNHKLVGDYVHHWECHIEPDWLLVYKRTDSEIILIRTGSHSDLF